MIKFTTTNPQELFDRAVGHLRILTNRNTDVHGQCAYGGKRCAVGALLEWDEDGAVDVAEWDRAGTYDVTEILGYVVNGDALDKDTVDLLGELQTCHDSSINWDYGVGLNAYGEERLYEIAEHYGLDYLEPV